MLNFADINYDKKYYIRSDVITFLKTHDKWGELSNMCAGFPIQIADIIIKTLEAFYASMRYPLYPSHQLEIISKPSPMGAKMTSKKYRKDERPDWSEIHVQLLEWCATLKLLQHWNTFGPLLDVTGDMPIVEETNKYDMFWAARRTKDNPDILEGTNIFGQILMNVRTFYRKHKNDEIYVLEPMDIPNFKFLGQEITATEYMLAA